MNDSLVREGSVASSAAAARRTTRRPPPRPAPWWGDGEAPHKRWPGVTIEIAETWVAKRGRWESHGGRFYFDVGAAEKVCDFFPTFLSHHIGEFAGQSFDLLDYQRVLLRAVMGWKRTADGLRRFRKVLLFVGKGAGKSPLGSGLGIYLMLCDDEPGAEVYAVASTKKQAKVVHNSAKIMVDQSADLSEMCEAFTDSIYCASSRSFYQVLSADAPGSHGVRPHAVIIDELHAQPNRDLFEALERSMLKRRQPLMVMLSHAGDDDEGICYEEYEYAKNVIAGAIADETYYAMIFEVAAEDDWTDPAIWRKANPTMGITVKEEGLAVACKAAQAEPRKRNDFLRYNLNRWVGQAVSWIPVEWWDGGRETFDDERLKGLICAAGLDMAQKIDLASFVVVFREPLQGPPVEVTVIDEAGEEIAKPEARILSLNYRVYIVPFFWLPEETVREREREGFIGYRQWQEAGLLTVTDGAVIDYDQIYNDITTKILGRFPLLKQGQIGYDPAFATDIATKLREKAGLQAIEVLQNYKYMNEPCHAFEGLVKAKRAVHDGNKLMRWNVANVAVKTDDAGRIRPVKPRRSGKKIDGVVATLMGLSRLMAQPDRPKKPRVYVFGGSV